MGKKTALFAQDLIRNFFEMIFFPLISTILLKLMMVGHWENSFTGKVSAFQSRCLEVQLKKINKFGCGGMHLCGGRGQTQVDLQNLLAVLPRLHVEFQTKPLRSPVPNR